MILFHDGFRDKRMTRIRIPSQGLEALQTLSSVDAQKFNALASAVVNMKKPSIRASALYNLVFDETKDTRFSKAFSSLFISLALFLRSEGVDASRIVDDLRDALVDLERESSLQHSGLEISQWFSEVQSNIVSVLNSRAVILASKALDLSVDFDCLYTSANVVTDIRPVFDDSKLEVSGAIIAQTLRLHFVPDGPASGEKEISLALDYDDIVKLISELENAKLKAETLKKHFSQANTVEIFSIGEETYGFD
jgi:hypothetical protein